MTSVDLGHMTSVDMYKCGSQDSMLHESSGSPYGI